MKRKTQRFLRRYSTGTGVPPSSLSRSFYRWKKPYIDIVFPFIMGETGEDGALQGLLQMAGIPWVGSGVTASACGMDKGVTNLFAKACGFLLPVYCLLDGIEIQESAEQAAEKVYAFFLKELGEAFFPLYVKPATTGSSVGITRVQNEKELVEALAFAGAFSRGVIVEQSITGRELKVAVLENNGIDAGEICEILVENGVYNTYEMKYKSNGLHKKIPFLESALFG